MHDIEKSVNTTITVSASNDQDFGVNRKRCRCIAWSLLAFGLVAGITGTVIYFLTRSNTGLQAVETSAEESLPSLIKVAPIGEGGGAILLEYTESLEDPTKLFYYINVQDLDFTTTWEDEGVVTDTDNLALYLTRSTDITIQELAVPNSNNQVTAQQSRSGLDNHVIRIGLVNRVEFPYRLPKSFLPGDFNGVLLVVEEEVSLEQDDIIVEEVVSRASFDIVLAPERNIASSTVEQNISTPTEEPAVPSISLPPTLTASLSGNYRIGGTITIDYNQQFQNGAAATVPVLQFDIPSNGLSNAPGPYLYLSKRPYSETKRGDLTSDDIYIPMDEVSGGEFVVSGRFDQLLDEIDDAEELTDYANGSWIVWCRPFGVWLGGGPITAA